MRDTQELVEGAGNIPRQGRQRKMNKPAGRLLHELMTGINSGDGSLERSGPTVHMYV